MQRNGSPQIAIATVQSIDGTLIIAVSGVLDTAAAVEFERAVLALLGKSAEPEIRLDLTEVRYLNSQGAEAIQRIAARDDRITVTGLSARSNRVLDLLDPAPPTERDAGGSAR